MNPVFQERYAVLDFEFPNVGPVFLSAVHLVKPWMTGISESEISRLAAQYNWFDGPVVAVGDFNMPPWSLPMRTILDETGFRAVRGQPGSWPVSAGTPRLPIDQVLVKSGPVVLEVDRFGEGLGSNHLGFIATVSLTGDSK